MEKYLIVLYELGSSVDAEHEKTGATPMTPMTPLSPMTPQDEDDDEMRQVLLQRVLQHIVIKVLPSVKDASARMQVIWVVAQFVRSSELQQVLLGLVLRRLLAEDQTEVKIDDHFAKFEHVRNRLDFLTDRRRWRTRAAWRWRRRAWRRRTWCCRTCCCVASC